MQNLQLKITGRNNQRFGAPYVARISRLQEVNSFSMKNRIFIEPQIHS